MTMQAEDITCTLCGIPLPVPMVPVVGVPGTVTIDSTFVDEHVAMHTTCTCEWSGDMGKMALVEAEPTCPHHGLTERDYAAVSDGNLLPDILTDEEDVD